MSVFTTFRRVSQFGDAITGKDRAFHAIPLLLHIVLQQAEGLFAQQRNGDEVADGDQSHSNIGQAPSQIEAGQGTK